MDNMERTIWRGCGEKQTLLHSWWKCKLVQPLWRTVWRFLNELPIIQPCYPAIPLLGIHPEKTTIQKDTSIPVFSAALFTIARTWKQLWCPLMDEWKNKLSCIYTMEYSVQFSHSLGSNSLQPHGLQHARLPCPSPTPSSCSNSCPLSQWCYPNISSSVVPFSFCLQYFQDQGIFQWIGSSYRLTKH